MTATVLVTSQEKIPIFPVKAGQPVTPDDAAVVKIGTDINTLVDADFNRLATLETDQAVWVRDLPVGTYRVVCRLDAQGDGQRPIWELDGTITIRSRV